MKWDFLASNQWIFSKAFRSTRDTNVNVFAFNESKIDNKYFPISFRYRRILKYWFTLEFFERKSLKQTTDWTREFMFGYCIKQQCLISYWYHRILIYRNYFCIRWNIFTDYFVEILEDVFLVIFGMICPKLIFY